MAKKNYVPKSPTLSMSSGLKLLQKMEKSAEEMISSANLSEDDYKNWKRNTEQALIDTFGEGHDNTYHFQRQGESVVAVLDLNSYHEESPQELEKKRREKLQKKKAALSGTIEQIKQRLELEDEELNVSHAKPVAAKTKVKKDDEVFIVHGHNDGLKSMAARLISQLGLTPIILHEQANRGQTIIEKFETHSAEVGFALVLLTGDDFGRAKDSSTERIRARQNVILELGFFMGSLGRSKVCALYEKDVEIPSDFAGVLYVEVDQGEDWKYKVAKELKSAGFNVDMNKV